MKATDLLKIAAVAVFTTGFAVGCSTGSEETAPVVEEAECEGPTAEVKNAIYAAKLKNARARNLGYEWRDTAKIIEEAEKAAENCENDRAKMLADKAEAQASDAIAQHNAEKAAMEDSTAEPEPMPESKYLGGYLVVSGDNLWDIAGQDSIYGNPYQWPLIYKANSDQINDADLIFPGQYFNIPKAMAAESAAAIEHAKTRGAWTIGETEASDIQYLNQ